MVALGNYNLYFNNALRVIGRRVYKLHYMRYEKVNFWVIQLQLSNHDNLNLNTFPVYASTSIHNDCNFWIVILCYITKQD